MPNCLARCDFLGCNLIAWCLGKMVQNWVRTFPCTQNSGIKLSVLWTWTRSKQNMETMLCSMTHSLMGRVVLQLFCGWLSLCIAYVWGHWEPHSSSHVRVFWVLQIEMESSVKTSQPHVRKVTWTWGYRQNMTHPGRHVDGYGKREETKNNSSTEGWSLRLVFCHIGLLLLKIPPVPVESEMMAPAFGETCKPEADPASFQGRCSRCPLSQGFQGYKGFLIPSSPKSTTLQKDSTLCYN